MQKLWKEFKEEWLAIFSVAALIVWGIEVFWYPSGFHVVSYAFILLCFLTSLIFIDKCKDKILQSIALLFTAAADFFLILLQGQHKTLAMLFFLGAQIAYAMRTIGFAKGKTEKIINLSVRAFLSTVIGGLTVVLTWGNKDLPLFIISAVYYANLVVSILFSFLHVKKGAYVLLTGIGLLLFSLCDISIGFDFIIDIFSLGEGNLIYEIMNSGVSFVAIFYPPSQALLAISSYVKRK